MPYLRVKIESNSSRFTERSMKLQTFGWHCGALIRCIVWLDLRSVSAALGAPAASRVVQVLVHILGLPALHPSSPNPEASMRSNLLNPVAFEQVLDFPVKTSHWGLLYRYACGVDLPETEFGLADILLELHQQDFRLGRATLREIVPRDKSPQPRIFPTQELKCHRPPGSCPRRSGSIRGISPTERGGLAHKGGWCQEQAFRRTPKPAW